MGRVRCIYSQDKYVKRLYRRGASQRQGLAAAGGWTCGRRQANLLAWAVVGDQTKATTMNREQYEKVRAADGFIAALDQSGGSTPKALKLYGIPENAYSGEKEMYDRIHEMRTRIVTSPSFDGDRIMGAILFEDTMNRDIEGKGSAEYLWSVKRVVPFLKVDKGLLPEADGVQLMKPIPNLDALLQRAREKGVFGTKMRSVILRANEAGIAAIARQQFELGRQILAEIGRAAGR